MKKYIFIPSYFVFVLLFSSFLNIKNTQLKPKKSDSPQKIVYTKGKTLLKEYKLGPAYQSFYSSYVIASKENDSLCITKSLYRLAKIDHYNKDYITCEHNLTNAIQYIPTKHKLKYKLMCYKLMAVNLKEKSNYKDASIYFNKFRDTYLNKKDTLLNFVAYSNNMGMLYQKAKDYKKSIFYFNNVIQVSKLKKIAPIKYARALDNKAWSLFQDKQYEKALPLFIQAKDLRKKIDDKPGLVMSFYHLGRFYQFKNQPLKAKEYSLQTLQVAKNIGDIEGRLKSLFLLSKIENTKSHVFFKQYKSVKDSLIEKERQFKHQSSRIRFETAEKEAEIRLQKIRVESKNRIIFWISTASIIFGISSLLFFLQKKKIAKQKENIQELQKEVHHTAKNNLKLALVFISKIRNKPSVENFIGLDNRIKSMLVLHEQLYKETSNGKVYMQQYIQTICQSLHLAYSDSSKSITYDLDITQDIPYLKAARLGLIINELVTNIYKYAFTEKEQGNYRIEIKESKKKILILVTDNGIGFPKGFDKDKLTSYGLNMVSGLVKQINGTIAFKREKGNTKIYIFV